MAEYKAGRIRHSGKWFDLRVDEDGNWLTEVDGQGLKHLTRAKLVSDIERVMRLKKKAVNIPFTKVESKNNGYVTLRHGVVTGIHSGTGNLLVAWDDGGNGQLPAGYSSEILRRLTPGEEGELKLLTKEANDSAEALRGFTQQRQIHKGAKGLAEQVEAELRKGQG